MTAKPSYYNEFNREAAEWLRELIKAGHIAAGDVDTRSIEDVTPDDLRPYTQCHFFAGIAGWPLALRLAGVPDDRPIWTGSAPCQPFSSAGKGAGFADERHLWPAFFHLIEKCRPPKVVGEQVASADGRTWLDLVFGDLEGAGYATGAANLSACGVGAPHIRQRLYWVADAQQHHRGRQAKPADHIGQKVDRSADQHGGCGGASVRLADSDGEDCSGRGIQRPGEGTGPSAGATRERLAGLCQIDGWMPGPTNGHWRAADWLGCRDGKWRPVVGSHVGMADGLPVDMVRSSDESALVNQKQKEGEVNGATNDQDAGEIVRPLREGDGTQVVRELAGGSVRVYAPKVLRPGMHGGSNGEGAVQQQEPRQDEGSQERQASVIGVRENRLPACPPQGRGPYQQRSIELEDVVPVLSSSLALAELHGRWRDAEALRSLSGAICSAGAVQFAPESAEAIWERIGREGQDRIRMDFGHVWVTRSFFPLSKGEPARVMRLRGYGNAIVPQVAAAFVRAAS